MTWLAAKLKHRIIIEQPQDTANASGGFTRGYTTLTTIWANLKVSKSIEDFVQSVRGENTGKNETHEFLVRRDAVKNLGRSYTTAYSSAYASKGNLNPLKNDMFIFVKTTSSDIGRRFKIIGVKNDEHNKEFIKIRAKEMEEIGTGWPE